MSMGTMDRGLDLLYPRNEDNVYGYDGQPIDLECMNLVGC